MRKGIALVLSVILAIGFTAPATAVSNDQEQKKSGNAGEWHPDCSGGSAESSAITIDLRQIGVPVNQRIPVRFDFNDNGQDNLAFCTGEHWDGEDPNRKDSSGDTYAEQDTQDSYGEDRDIVVYVNPLGDCSTWKDPSGDNGCPGGTDRPNFYVLRDGESEIPIDVRATASADVDDGEVVVYVNEEIWGLGRGAPAVGVDHDDREGYVSVYLEDHSDQIFDDDGELGAIGAGNILAGNDYDRDGNPDSFDGNYLCIPFDPLQAGNCREGDCDQETYQSDTPCDRDNSALATLSWGYDFAFLDQVEGSVDTPETGPNPLP